MKLNKWVVILSTLLTILLSPGCASLKEVTSDYPILTHIVISNAVTQRIKASSDPVNKATLYMTGVSRLRGAGGGSLPYSTLGEFVRGNLNYNDADPATRKLIDDSLLLIGLVLKKELGKRGLTEIPSDYIVDLAVYLDAIEAGARVYLPQ